MPVQPDTGESCALMACKLCLQYVCKDGAARRLAEAEPRQQEALGIGVGRRSSGREEKAGSSPGRGGRVRGRAGSTPDGGEPQGVVRIELRGRVPKVPLEDETPRLVDDVHGEHHPTTSPERVAHAGRLRPGRCG